MLEVHWQVVEHLDLQELEQHSSAVVVAVHNSAVEAAVHHIQVDNHYFVVGDHTHLRDVLHIQPQRLGHHIHLKEGVGLHNQLLKVERHSLQLGTEHHNLLLGVEHHSHLLEVELHIRVVVLLEQHLALHLELVGNLPLGEEGSHQVEGSLV